MSPLGYRHTPEARTKISAALRGNQRTLGLKHSKETLAAMRARQRGPTHNSWKGGTWKDGRGYIHIYAPDHPHAHVDGYVYQHRLAMEAHLGRLLLPTEVVHHINGILDDNRIENLALFPSHRKHMQDRHSERGAR